METTRQFPYKGRWSLVLSAIFFGIGSLVTLQKAFEAYRTYQTGAAIFLWSTSGFSFAMAALSLLLAIMRQLRRSPVIVFNDNGLFLACGFLQRKTVWIPFAGIRAVTEVKTTTHTLLILETTDGKFTVSSILLSDKDSYNDVKRLLLSGMKERRSIDGMN